MINSVKIRELSSMEIDDIVVGGLFADIGGLFVEYWHGGKDEFGLPSS